MSHLCDYEFWVTTVTISFFRILNEPHPSPQTHLPVCWDQRIPAEKKIIHQLHILCVDGIAECWDEAEGKVIRPIEQHLAGIVTGHRAQDILQWQPKGFGGRGSPSGGLPSGQQGQKRAAETSPENPKSKSARRNATRKARELTMEKEMESSKSRLALSSSAAAASPPPSDFSRPGSMASAKGAKGAERALRSASRPSFALGDALAGLPRTNLLASIMPLACVMRCGMVARICSPTAKPLCGACALSSCPTRRFAIRLINGVQFTRLEGATRAPVSGAFRPARLPRPDTLPTASFSPMLREHGRAPGAVSNVFTHFADS